MKVCFLAGTLGRGGAEKQLIYMLQALRADQVETRVMCLTKGETFENDIAKLGIDIDWIGSSQNQFVRLGKIIRNLQKRPADILQSSHFYTNIYTALAGRALCVRNIGAIRNDIVHEIASNRSFSKWQLQLPQKLVANSQIAVDRAIAKGIRPANIELVRNVVASEMNGHVANNRSSIRILFAGRLVPQKRAELFIETASQLLKRLPDAKLEFIIAGDGPLRSGLERFVVNHGIGEQLSFLGEQEDMSEVYRTSDMLVLTSDHEGTPNVILEAMAHGLPVVATNVGGIPDIVNEECGILVEPANVEEMIQASTKLILDRELRRELGKQGKDYVGKHHSIGYLRDRLKCIYSDILGDPIAHSESRSIN